MAATPEKRLARDYTLQALVNAVDGVREVLSGRGSTIYAFHIDANESDPSEAVTYLKDAVGMVPAKMNFTSGKFEWGSWQDAFFMPKPCMLNSDGTVDYYLDPDDYTKKEDGTPSDVANTAYDGNAMMEWGQNGKKIWMKIVPDADHLGASVYVADYQADADYHDWPFHNSAGESTDHFYTAIYNGSLISDKLRSLSGQAVMKTKTAEQEVNYAKANNVGSADKWNIDIYSDAILINMLLYMMGKSLDTQTVYGMGLVNSGTEAINDAFRTGVHNTKGMFYGTNDGAAATYTNAVKVFGMENWWGVQLRRTLGMLIVDGAIKFKNTVGTEDGSTVNGYNLTGEGYKSAGVSPVGSSNNDGYVKEMYFTEDGMFPKTAIGGSSSTYYCDWLYFIASGVGVPRRGGYSAYGLHAGASSWAFTAASSAWWDHGAALSCK